MRQAELGLRPHALEEDALLFNYQKRAGQFALKPLKAGTIVLVDKDGVPRYEEKCGNRLIDPRQLTPVVAAVAPPPQPASRPEVSGLDAARTWVAKLPEPAKLAVHGLAWLAALALLAGGLILAIWGLGALGKKLVTASLAFHRCCARHTRSRVSRARALPCAGPLSFMVIQ
ncbi:hypothetical protein HY478_02415 [Candidatus Uhrbacteria bacterium]|nr:hypothetical protein [Candidatus Uhrbacteria bacterium]